MKKGFIVLIVLGAVFTTAGAVMLGIGLSHDVKISQPVVHEYVLEEAFNKVNIDIATADINFYRSEDTTNKVICNEREKQYHVVEVKDNALSITYKDELNWYERLFTFNSSKIQLDIYLGNPIYDSLAIKASTGDINLAEKLEFKDANIDVSTGNVYFASYVTNTLGIKASTGDIHLDKVDNGSLAVNLETSTGKKEITSSKIKSLTCNSSTGRTKISNTLIDEELFVKASTGDVEIFESDAGTVNIETSTGDVDAVFLTGKSVIPETSTGDIKVTPATGGSCYIKTSTGDIRVSYK